MKESTAVTHQVYSYHMSFNGKETICSYHAIIKVTGLGNVM